MMTNDKLKCYLAPKSTEIVLFTRDLVCTSPMGFGNSSIDPFEEINYDDIED